MKTAFSSFIYSRRGDLRDLAYTHPVDVPFSGYQYLDRYFS